MPCPLQYLASEHMQLGLQGVQACPSQPASLTGKHPPGVCHQQLAPQGVQARLQRQLMLLPLLPLQQQLALQGGAPLPLALQGCTPGGLRCREKGLPVGILTQHRYHMSWLQAGWPACRHVVMEYPQVQYPQVQMACPK